LVRLQGGLADAEAIWQKIQSRQRFRPHWTDTSVANSGSAVNSSAGRILIGAVLNAALQNAAYRSANRRSPSNWSVPSMPPMPSARSASRGPFFSPPPIFCGHLGTK
jgi:hypothetical protein